MGKKEDVKVDVRPWLAILVFIAIIALAMSAEAQRIRITFAPILEMDPKWSGNITACSPYQRLHFIDGNLACNVVQAFPNQSVFMSRNSTNPNATLNYGTWTSIGTIAVGGKTIYIWERIT